MRELRNLTTTLTLTFPLTLSNLIPNPDPNPHLPPAEVDVGLAAGTELLA